MSLILRILKNIWPSVTFGGRAPISRAKFRTLPDGTLRTVASGEVRTLPL